MIIEQTFDVDAERDRVADFLLDPERMLYCVPGVESVERLDDNRYAAELKVKVGPVRAAFKGEFALDGSQAPESIVAEGQGRDRASGSSVNARLDAALTEDDATTTVATRVDITIRGRLGQFGSGVMQAISNEMVGEFSRCLQARLSGDEGATAGDASSPNIASVAARGVMKGAGEKLSGLRKRGDRTDDGGA